MSDEVPVIVSIDNDVEYNKSVEETKKRKDELRGSKKFELITTTKPEEVYELVEQNKVSGVAVDFEMPTKGTTVVSRVKAINPKVKCVFITNHLQNRRLIKYSEEEGIEVKEKSTSQENNYNNIELTFDEVPISVNPMLDYVSEQNDKIKRFKEPLLLELRLNPNQDSTIQMSDGKQITVRQLQKEISKETDIGKHHIELWIKSQELQVKLRNKKFREEYELDKRNIWDKIKAILKVSKK